MTRITGICAEGESWHQATHGLMHKFQSAAAAKTTKDRPRQTFTMQDGRTMSGKPTTYGETRDQGVRAVRRAFPESKCNKACLKAQLDAYHQSPAVGMNDKTPCKAIMTGKKKEWDNVKGALKEVNERTKKFQDKRGAIDVSDT